MAFDPFAILPRLDVPPNITGEGAMDFDRNATEGLGLEAYIRPIIPGEFELGPVKAAWKGQHNPRPLRPTVKAVRKQIRRQLSEIVAEGLEPAIVVKAVAPGQRLRMLVGVRPRAGVQA